MDHGKCCLCFSTQWMHSYKALCYDVTTADLAGINNLICIAEVVFFQLHQKDAGQSRQFSKEMWLYMLALSILTEVTEQSGAKIIQKLVQEKLCGAACERSEFLWEKDQHSILQAWLPSKNTIPCGVGSLQPKDHQVEMDFFYVPQASCLSFKASFKTWRPLGLLL